MQGNQEPGRMKRLLKGSAEFANRLATGALSGLIAAYLKAKFGI